MVVVVADCVAVSVSRESFRGEWGIMASLPSSPSTGAGASTTAGALRPNRLLRGPVFGGGASLGGGEGRWEMEGGC